GVVRPCHVLLVEVVRAQVEVVVADEGGVDAEQRQGAHLHLALVDVEDRRALEAVSGVEPDRARRLRPLPLDDRADARDSAEWAIARNQAIALLRTVRDISVRKQTGVNVGGMDDGNAYVLAHQVRGLTLDGARRRRRDEPRDENDANDVWQRRETAHCTGRVSQAAGGAQWFFCVIRWVGMRRAKIVCTLGPASRAPDVIGGLIDAGMDVARLNFSHGDHDTHLAALRAVRAEA